MRLGCGVLCANARTEPALAIQQSRRGIARCFRNNLAPDGTLRVSTAMIGERNEELQIAHYACCLLHIRTDA
jgi:hypothetical protein